MFSHFLALQHLDSLSSLIEITQSGSTSINIKLPSLHVPPPTIQGEMTNGQNSPQSLVDVNTSPFDVPINSRLKKLSSLWSFKSLVLER